MAQSHLNYCTICKGECWTPNDNAATQKAALEKFGVIPNKCANPELGKPLCPYAKKNN